MELKLDERTAAPLQLELDDRIAVRPSPESLRDLIEYWQFGGDPMMSPPLCLGWDMHRHWPAEGFEIWCDMMHEWEPPFLATELLPGDMRRAVTLEEYDAALIEQWSWFAREKHWTDHLIIDAMHYARQTGWIICGPDTVVQSTEAILDDLARRSGAKRAAVEADMKAASDRCDARHYRFIDLDDAYYHRWIEAGAPDGRKARFSRWKKRRKEEDEAIARFEAARAPGIPMPTSAGPLRIVPAALPDLLTSSADFIAGFVPPEYLIDGIVQRRYFYSMTAQTGVGKTTIAMRWMAHVAAGRPIGDKDVQQGNVLYLAGENPDDVRARWLVLSREMGIDPDTKNVTWIVGAKDLGAEAQRFLTESTKKGLSFAYVAVDTAAAYNVAGDDENSNTQAGAYARQLRSLTNLPGGPCVVVLCHPTKRAKDDDLMPRGGGAFLAEVDGNMAVMRKDSLLVVAPFGKFRGDMSWSQRYEIEVVKDHPKLKDARGRQMNSVLARPVGDGVAAVMGKRTDADTETVLDIVHSRPSATPSDLARLLGWTFGPKAAPNVNRVKRNLARLAKDKLVREVLGKWRVTPAGEKELNAIDNAKVASLAMPPMPPLPYVKNND